MVEPARPPRLTVPIAGAGSAAAAAMVVIACLASPARWLAAAVVRSGLPALLPAAAPPLGLFARLMLAGAGGIGVGAVAWAALVLLIGDRRLAFILPWRDRRRVQGGVPTVRRADSHPDAPPRPPILAERDLGLPFLDVVAPAADERQWPRDLETPLAAYDPDAIPATPLPAASVVPPLASRVVPLAPGERIASIELTPQTRHEPASVEALLARLERGARPPRSAGRPSTAESLQKLLNALGPTTAGA